MSGTGRISGPQLTCMVALFGSSATLLFLPGPLTRIAGPDAWLTVPVGAVGGALLPITLLAGLARYHPRRSMGEIAEACLGRWGGRLVSLLVAAYSLFLASLIVRNIMDFSTVAILPGTPLSVTGGLFALAAAYGAYNGGEVVARWAALVLILTVVTSALLPLGLVNEFDILRMLPVMGDGIGPILRAAYPLVGWYGEVWIFGAWLGMLDRPRQVFRHLALGVLLAAVLLDTVVIAGLLTFGADLVMREIFPSYATAQLVSVGEFVERVEISLITIWLSGMYAKASIVLWATGVSLSRLLGLKSDRKLYLPLAAAAVGLALIWPSIMVLLQWSNRYWAPLTLPPAIGVPGLLLAISWWRRRGKGVPG